MKTLLATICGLALVASASVHAEHRSQKRDGYVAFGYQQGGHYRGHQKGHIKSNRNKHYNNHYNKHSRAHNKHYSNHHRGHKSSHAPRYGSRYYNAPRYRAGHRAGHHGYNRHNDGLSLLGGVLVGKLLHDSVHHDRQRAAAPSNSRHERQQRSAQRSDHGRDRSYVSPRHQRDERRR